MIPGTFFLAAKLPVPGRVKTRLAPLLGPAGAADLYRAFLLDLGERFPEAGWFVEPGAWPELSALITHSPAAPVRHQHGATWADRQHRLFSEAAKSGELPLVLAASDSPHLEVTRVEAAFTALRHADIVFGPTFDGGYYLVGMQRSSDVLLEAAMSTETALDDALARARSQGLRVALLEPTFDVDIPSDLALLAAEVGRRRDLTHTARAMSVAAGG